MFYSSLLLLAADVICAFSLASLTTAVSFSKPKLTPCPKLRTLLEVNLSPRRLRPHNVLEDNNGHFETTDTVIHNNIEDLKDEQYNEISSLDVVVAEKNRRSIFLHAVVAGGIGNMALLNYGKASFAAEMEPPECANGAIVAESAVPGAYQQICMTLPTRSIRLASTGDVISIVQGTAARAATMSSSAASTRNDNSSGTESLSGRTGVALWNSGILLTRLLDVYGMEHRTFLENKTVLELGCGTGLASIAAHKLGAGKVIATDGNDEVVQLAQLNLERNEINVSPNSNGGSNEATMLKWGALDAIDYYQEADFVMGSDLTYNAANWGLLAETFDTVLRPDGVVMYLTLGHAGFAVEGELGGFLTTVQSQGHLEYMKEDGIMLEKLLSASLSEDEKRVIQGTGGFKVAVFKKKKRR